MPTFSSVICHALEGGTRKNIIQQRGKLPDDYIVNICKILQLNVPQMITIAYAFSQSQYRGIALDALRILKQKLPELSSSAYLSEMSEETIRGLIHLISTTEVFDRQLFTSLNSLYFNFRNYQ
jgi:hypothetical protein